MGTVRWSPRGGPGADALPAFLVFLALTVSGCRAGPEPIAFGLEECAFCRMVIDEPATASQALSESGRAYKFDSVECLAAFTLSAVPEEGAIGSLWVADFGDPDRWLRVEEATFLRSPRLRSPMGMDLTAHGSRETAEELREIHGGEILPWEEVRDLVGRELQHGAEPHSHGAEAHSHGAYGAEAHSRGAHGAEPHRPREREAEGHAEAGAPGPPLAPGAREIAVGPGQEASTIARALALARDGDRILIRPGTYRERGLVVDRSVSLVGQGWPLIDGEGVGSLLQVRADGVEIRGLRFTGTGMGHVRDHAAIEVEEAADCVIEGNRFEDNLFGIVLARARGCRVADNRLQGAGGREAASGNGIHLWHSAEVRIERNEVRSHRDAIYLEFSESTVVEGNRAADNHRYGLHFMFSDGSRVTENDFRRNGAGVAVMYTRRVEMERNRFADNWGPASYGLLLKEITDSRIHGNRFRRNTVALYSEGSDRVEVSRNRFEGNGWAVKVMSNSQENRFLENDFLDNAFEVATNSRRNPNHFEGNHWSRYAGYDLTGDGFGDVPHRPVRLFALVVERNPIALVLLRSPFVDLLDMAERVLPVLTPETLVDGRPSMREVTR